eukprot:6706390-Prymnesium_polylepis.2
MLQYYDCTACMDTDGNTLPICEYGSTNFSAPEGCDYDKGVMRVVQVSELTNRSKVAERCG